MTHASPRPTAFWEAFGINVVWMNLSETARYFLVVKPAVARDFAEVPGITPDAPLITALWVAWDTVLIGATTAIVWLVLQRYGSRHRAALGAAVLVWASVFVLLWLGMHNMGLARAPTLATALPLALIELVVAAEIVRWRFVATPRPGVLPGAIGSGARVSSSPANS